MESDPLLGHRRGYDEQPLLVHHVAKICGISPRTVRWAAAKGILKAFRDPRTPKIWRFWRNDVYAYLAGRGVWRELPVSVRLPINDGDMRPIIKLLS